MSEPGALEPHGGPTAPAQRAEVAVHRIDVGPEPHRDCSPPTQSIAPPPGRTDVAVHSSCTEVAVHTPSGDSAPQTRGASRMSARPAVQVVSEIRPARPNTGHPGQAAL